MCFRPQNAIESKKSCSGAKKLCKPISWASLSETVVLFVRNTQIDRV
jgi:hypothetical protein